MHDLILKKKDSLNSLIFKIKTKKRTIEEKIKIPENLDEFLHLSLKEEIKLQKKFKEKKSGLEIDLEKDFEKENLNLNFLFETKKEKLIEIKNEIEIFKEKIPKELRNEKFLKQYEKDIFKKQKELEKEIDLINSQKEKEEKILNNLNLKIENVDLNFKETTKEEKTAKEDFLKKLEETGSSLEEFLLYFKDFSAIKEFVEKYEKILKEFEEIKLKIETIEKDISSMKILNMNELTEKKKKLVSTLNKLKNKEKIMIKTIAVKTSCFEEIKINQKEIEKLEENFKTAKILSEVAKGNKKRIGFEKYVLTACLNEVLIFANEWLKKATSNRYYFHSLEEKDCLKFNVFDSYSGKIRHVSTLSGGETFAASLALSLGLCSRFSNIAGGIELNTMLIDEGFGTLDSTYLDSVVSCLLNLKKSGRQIGIISHVLDLKNKIKSQIVVGKSEEGGSKIQLKF